MANYLINIPEQSLIVPKLLTVPETATELRVSHWTVRTLIKDKKLPATKVGNQWRISVANLNDYINRSEEN